MKITLSSATKSFGREIVFRDLSHVFERGSRTAVLGPNGSGKSTLLQCVAGALTLTKGTITHEFDGTKLEQEQVYRHVSIAAPYLNLYEDLSLQETIGFHARFKPLRAGIDVQAVARTAMLEANMDKPVRNFSSGMKQRLKLSLAILSDTPLLLLDEPTSNLDAAGTDWFQQLLAAHLDARTLIVASNRQAVETALCTSAVEVERWK
ncbi:MAG: ABC transporter ATP-binding protein [Flavobacteriales bacterium]